MPRPSFPRDLASAYLASLSRIASGLIISALVFRRSTEAFAMLALVRGTIGILNYASLGLLPAMIRMFALTPSPPVTPGGEGRGEGGARPLDDVHSASTLEQTDKSQLEPGDDTLGSFSNNLPTSAVCAPIPLQYVSPSTTNDNRLFLRFQGTDRATRAIYETGIIIAVFTAVLATYLCLVAATSINHLYRLPTRVASFDASLLVFAFGLGYAIRWCSDPAGALMQTRGRISLDNWLLATCEISWVLMTIALRAIDRNTAPTKPVAIAFVLSSILLLILRMCAAYSVSGVAPGDRLRFDRRVAGCLLLTGSLITLAQLADYLYAPTDYILINRLLTPFDLASYAPAMQIDSGLLILVTALAAVLLPKAALAHAAGHTHSVRRDYLRATAASAALLAAASIVIYFASPLIFRVWLGQDMPETRAILPLILLNTTIGGSAMIGRSILLATGRHTPFAISVLLAGLTNVFFSYAFVRYFHWGLKGIVAGTLVAVIARCIFWMPWYVLHSLKTTESPSTVSTAELLPPTIG